VPLGRLQQADERGEFGGIFGHEHLLVAVGRMAVIGATDVTVASAGARKKRRSRNRSMPSRLATPSRARP
jgi:hypothetical protein